jgi:hypothetical protein
VVNTAVKIALIQRHLFEPPVGRRVIAKEPSVPCAAAFDAPLEECRSEPCLGVAENPKMSNKCSIAKKLFTRCFAEAKQAGVDYLAKTKKICIAALAQAKHQRPEPKQKTKQGRIACSAKAKQIGMTYFVKAKQNHNGGFAKAIQIVDLARFAKAKHVCSVLRCASRDCVDAERIAPCQTARDHGSSARARTLSKRADMSDTWRLFAWSHSAGSLLSKVHSMP